MTEYKAGSLLSLLAGNTEESLNTSNVAKEKKKSKKLSKDANEIDAPTIELPVGVDKIVPKPKIKIVEEPNSKLRVAQNAETENRTVFVGNVPSTLSNKEIKKLFTKFGKIEAVYERTLITKNKKLTLKMLGTNKKIKTNLTTTNFFVRFADEQSAELALEMNGYLLDTNVIRVSLSGKKEFNASKTIFVGNLPFTIQEQQIREHFSKCGEIERVRVIHDTVTGSGRGIAYVEYKELSSIFSALKFNESEFMGRKIRVQKNVKKEKVMKFKCNKLFQREKLKPKKREVKKSLENQKLFKKLDGFSTLKGQQTSGTGPDRNNEENSKKKPKIPRAIKKIIQKKHKKKSKSIMN